MTKACRNYRGSFAALCCIISLARGRTPAKQAKPKDSLEPARAALRTLQSTRRSELLNAAGNTGNADAQYLLGLMYSTAWAPCRTPKRARALLQSAAEDGQGAAAYVLARIFPASPMRRRNWHTSGWSAPQAGYVRAATHSIGRPLLDRESVGATDPALLTAWVIDCCAQKRCGRIAPAREGERRRARRIRARALSYAAAAGTVAAATALLELGADIRRTTKPVPPALMIAASSPMRPLTLLLLQHGADTRLSMPKSARRFSTQREPIGPQT